MKIGILAVQGAFVEHKIKLESIGIRSFEIRQKQDLDENFDGLILPGGESTVMGKLLKDLDLYEGLKKRIEEGFPVFGTCAGLILLSEEIENSEIKHFTTFPMKVKRNAYGKQLGSFQTIGHMKGIGEVPMTFIRAPFIVSVRKDVEVLSIVKEHIVAARYKNQLVTAFHPELSNDTLVHQYFIDIVKKKINAAA